MTPVLTLVALVAFASNSLLCRLALAPREIDPASFTLIRIASGAAILLLLTLRGGARTALQHTRAAAWRRGALLFLYAAPFSFAYMTLSAGTGALILFGAVQVTMLIGAIRSGERFGPAQGAGLLLAIAGLIYLVFPGLKAPHPIGSALMAVAGIAWGLYSLAGRGSKDPLRDTTANFVRAVPLAILLSLPAAPIEGVHFTARGVALASASGALASALGYTVWFAALRGLTGISASVVQLLTPVLAAFGGVLLLHESITLRLVLSALLILGGVGVALLARAQDRPSGGR